MAKLSEIFGRRASEGFIDRFAPSGASGNSIHPGESVNAETFSDIGSRMGEENEVLRNLLSDTGRKIGELDELKQAFAKLVQPFNSTLRALEQEKSQTINLTNRLDEARAAYETLRVEYYAIEKKATTLEAESEKQRDDIELARETNRALESTRLQLTDEINVRNVRGAELERQIEQETAQRRSLSESRRALQEQLDDAEKRILELESELAASREKLILLDDEKRSLQTSLDQVLIEVARLTRRITDTENSLTATRSQLVKVETNFSEIFAERGRLAATLDESKEQHQAERNSLNIRLDALQSRTTTAERLLAETRQNLIMRTEEVRAFDRKSVEAIIGRNGAEKRLAHLEASHERREQQFHDLEQARTILAERNSAITKTLKMRETALARTEEKIVALTERNGHLEADIQVSRTNIEKRIEDLNSALQRERMERAVVEGALEATRRDNARLQGEVTNLRSILRRGVPADESQMRPDEPANDENSLKAAGVETINAAISKRDER